MARSPSGAAATFHILTLGAVAFYSGYRPWLFGSLAGQFLLLLALIAPCLFALALRSERISWRGVFGIVGFTTFLLIALIYIPTWLTFTYLPAVQNPLSLR